MNMNMKTMTIQCAISDENGTEELANQLNAKMREGFKVVRVEVCGNRDFPDKMFIMEAEVIRPDVGGAE